MAIDVDLRIADLETVLDHLVAADQVQSNCMFQLAIMLAHIALEPTADAYKDHSAQVLLGLIRNKPKSTVVQLFGGAVDRRQPRILATH